jgi:hypothetical protein
MSLPRSVPEPPAESGQRESDAIRAARIGGRYAIAAAVMAAIVGAAATAVVTNGFGLAAKPATPAHQPTPTAAFDYPRNGATNIRHASTLRATGTVKNLEKGHHLFLFEWFYDDKYYAGNMPFHDSKNGHWSGSIFLGGAKRPGQQFTIWVLDLGPRAWFDLNSDANGVANGFHGWNLVHDARRLAFVTITVH